MSDINPHDRLTVIAEAIGPDATARLIAATSQLSQMAGAAGLDLDPVDIAGVPAISEHVMLESDFDPAVAMVQLRERFADRIAAAEKITTEGEREQERLARLPPAMRMTAARASGYGDLPLAPGAKRGHARPEAVPTATAAEIDAMPSRTKNEAVAKLNRARGFK